jgi:hypothetical protein
MLEREAQRKGAEVMRLKFGSRQLNYENKYVLSELESLFPLIKI